MIDLENVIARWKGYTETSPIHKHPTVWVAHFGQSAPAALDDLLMGREPPEKPELLGVLSSTEPRNIGNAVLFLLKPYAESFEVRESAVIVDVNRILHVTQMESYDASQRMVQYHLPWGIDDNGDIRFGIAEKAPSDYWSDCNIIYVQRGRGSQDFDFYSAFLAALYLGELKL
jgi:hypothetical protein